MRARRSRDGGIAFAIVIVLVALNLRAFLTSSSPLLEPIRLATGIGFHAVALLTVLPMFAMGATSLFGAAVGQRIGARGGVGLGLAAIALACASRYVAGGAAALLWSAALAGAGVGLVQALMPGVVKQAYPARIGVMTGLYSAAIMGGGGLGAMASPWVAHAFGGTQPDWHAGLSIWSLLAVFALLYWLNMRRMEFTADAPRQGLSWLRCFASRRAWLLAACFGLINGGYTSLVAWLPHFYAQQGWTAQQGGSVLALMTAAQVVSALAMPAIARSRGRDLRPWLALTLAAQLAGFCALTFDAPAPAVAIAIVLGFGLGGAFSLCMVLALDHLPDPAQAGALAGFMQGVGFMIAALAPFVTGWVREHAGGFTLAWAYLAAVAVALLPLMLRFDPRRYAAATAGLFDARGPQAGAPSITALEGTVTRKV
ncbi:cyanate transporter [Variovorax guangxiensis]|uniref:CP family cyanate transporter-like MFS transporter n=1 Tax=Variovorax guangxiensis TaxID=1775474 RepID=A0A840FEF5_9BURK|nr:cyanate transporter [Variovorax guangxiensis]MBB4219462.1 CP family cyanate transporter-like MFS transporter [Variovorax guangxiensis]